MILLSGSGVRCQFSVLAGRALARFTDCAALMSLNCCRPVGICGWNCCFWSFSIWATNSSRAFWDWATCSLLPRICWTCIWLACTCARIAAEFLAARVREWLAAPVVMDEVRRFSMPLW